MTLCQRKYALNILTKSGFSRCKPTTFPIESYLNLSDHDHSPLLIDPASYKRLVGQLLYLIITRPDIAYSVRTLNQVMANPRSKHIQATERDLKYIEATPGHEIFLSASSSLHLKAYSNTNWAWCVTPEEVSLVLLFFS